MVHADGSAWLDLASVFFTENSLGWQTITLQFFQPLTPQTQAIVAAAIHCVLSEYATARKVTVMFSQDEYRGKFCPSTVIDCVTAEAIALIIIIHGGAASYPPTPMLLLRHNRRSSIPIGAPQSGMALQYFILCSILPFLSALLFWDGRSSIPSWTLNRSVSISLQTHYLSPLSALLSMDGLLCWICTPQSLSALVGLDFCPSISFCAPPSPSALPLPTSNSTSGIPPFLVAHLIFPQIHPICLSNSILIQR